MNTSSPRPHHHFRHLFYHRPLTHSPTPTPFQPPTANPPFDTGAEVTVHASFARYPAQFAVLTILSLFFMVPSIYRGWYIFQHHLTITQYVQALMVADRARAFNVPYLDLKFQRNMQAWSVCSRR